MNSRLPSYSVIAVLLSKAQIEGSFKIESLHGGYNNRIFRIDIGENHYCLKSYFLSPDDTRDRLGTEFGFLGYAWQMGIRTLPQPLAMDRDNNLGLYEFIEGEKLRSQDVTEKRLEEALNLYHALNNHKRKSQAEKLPKASEACFSLAEHLELVQYRVNRMLDIENSSSINREAVKFIRNELSPLWQKILTSVNINIQKLGFLLNEQLMQMDRCLSPSDFGFHNTILEADGRLRFIDFEYAGWDDPAKMVCDFFCQPAIPVPFNYYNMFAQTVTADLNKPEKQIRRFEMLFPVHQIKWCCIMLNDFLLAEAERRHFVKRMVDQTKQKKQQLEKARSALERIYIDRDLFT